MQNSIGSNVETLYRIVNNKAEALEFTIKGDAPVLGIPLKDLTLKKNLLIACVNRKGKIIIPNGMFTLEQGDTVVVVTTQQGLGDIRDILK